jgi:hypothetical protein
MFILDADDRFVYYAGSDAPSVRVAHAATSGVRVPRDAHLPCGAPLANPTLSERLMRHFRRTRKALLVLAALSAVSPVTVTRSGSVGTAVACGQDGGRCCFEDKSICVEGVYVNFDRYMRGKGSCESPAH